LFLKNHNKTALIWKDTKISYQHLMNNIDYYSTLFSKGNNRVAIFSENRLDWVYSFYAIWKNDSVVLPIDFMSHHNEVSYFLNDCKPNLIFYSDTTKKVLEEALKTVSHEIKLIKFEDITIPEKTQTTLEYPEMENNKTSVIIYSSGTTGSPKGVMLSFENLLANIIAVSEDVKIFAKEEMVMVMLPLHHTFPLLGTMLAPLYVGGTIAFSPSLVSEDIIATLNDNNVTIMIGVPRFYTVLMKNIKNKINNSKIATVLYNLSKTINSLKFSRKIFNSVHKKFGGHIKYMVCGGAAIDRNIEADYRVLGFEMLPGFGMTEAAPMITFSRPGQVRLGSTGQILKTNEVKITEEGEIITRGNNVMQGYYNKEKETNETIIDGWLHTGDIGYFDEDGYLFITGRKKEIIILPNGKNINPVNIEFKIQEYTECINEVGVFMHNDILQAVFTPDHNKLEEYEIKDFYKYLKTDIMQKYNKSVSPYKRIMKITVVEEELPKTRLDKIKRFKLKDLLASSDEKKDSVEPNFKEYSVIRDFISKQSERKVFPNDHFEFDLAMDSLDKVSFQVFLKKTFGVDIKEIHLEENPTVKKMSEYIREKSKKMKLEIVNLSDIFHEKVIVNLPKSGFTHLFIKNASKHLFNLYFRIKINNKENIPEAPFILAPNHQSYMDGLLVTMGLTNSQVKQTYFYAKEKHVRKPWVKRFANKNNVIVVDINNDLKLSLQKLASVIKQNNNIIIFPEGTRTNDGELGDFKKTFAILSKELNVPVVPVCIKGAYNALPTGKKMPKPATRISISFLKPVMPKDKTAEQIRDLIKSEIENNLK